MAFLYVLTTHFALTFGLSGIHSRVNQVVAGLRPSIPAACPAPIAALMRQCWAAEPRDRPSVPELIKQLTRLLLQFRASAADALIVDAAASARF